MKSITEIIPIDQIRNCRSIIERNRVYYNAQDSFKILFPDISDTNVSRHLQYVDNSEKTLYKAVDDVGRSSLYITLRGLIFTVFRLDKDISKQLKDYSIDAIIKSLNSF